MHVDFAMTEFYEVPLQKKCPPGICIALCEPLLECPRSMHRAVGDLLGLHPQQRRERQDEEEATGAADGAAHGGDGG